MSDYQRIKCVRYPASQDDMCKYLNCDKYDINETIEKLFPEMYDWRAVPRFRWGMTYPKTFLDYELYNDDGDGDWGKVRELNDSEKDKYEEIFSKIIPDVDKSKLKLVEYSWYNCSEAPDYYEVEDDPFYKEV